MVANLFGLIKIDSETLERNLLGKVRDLSASEAQDIVSLFPDLHFPGLITLLGLGATTSNQESRIIPFSLTEQNIADALAHLPSRGTTKHKDATRAAQLLLSGKFFGDIADAFATISHVAPGIPLVLAQDFRSLPRFPRRLILAIERDLGNAPSEIEAVIKDLRENGEINSQPKLLSNTIGVIYRQATPKQIASTIHTLLGNESVRLAIIVFARSKGVNISQEDLDQVREAINPDAPNFGALLAPGYQHMSQKFGKDQAMKLLDQFVF